MESLASLPERRLFHIDHECYVIYVGTDPKDDRPFLRIGAGKGLPPEAFPEIGTVIVSPSFSGNPLGEQDNIDASHPDICRYIGDGDLSRSYRRFLNALKLSSVNVKDYSELSESGHRSIVSFYDDGNITLSFNGTTLFDLFRRETRDHHFNSVSKNLARKLPSFAYRYSGQLYRNAGFFISEGCFFLIRDGSITAYGLPVRYFETLFRFGIDPDLVSSVVSRAVTDDLVNWFKRRRTVPGAGFVQSPGIERLRGLSELLSLQGLSFRAWDDSAEEGVIAPGIRFRLRPGAAEISYPGKNGKNLLRMRFTPRGAGFENGSGTVLIPHGIPVVLETVSPSREDCLKRFITPLPEIFKGSLSPECYRFCTNLGAALSDSNAGTLPLPVSSVLSASLFIPYFLQNCRSFASLESKRAELEPERKRLSRLQATLETLIGRYSGKTAHLPFMGVLSLDTGALFFSCSHAAYSELHHTQHLFVADSGQAAHDEAYFQKERERLVGFISELAARRRTSPVPEKVPAAGRNPRTATAERVPAAPQKPPAGGAVRMSSPEPRLRRTVGGSAGFSIDFGRLGRYVIPAIVLVAVCGGGYLVLTRMRRPGEKVAVRESEPVASVGSDSSEIDIPGSAAAETSPGSETLPAAAPVPAAGEHEDSPEVSTVLSAETHVPVEEDIEDIVPEPSTDRQARLRPSPSLLSLRTGTEPRAFPLREKRESPVPDSLPIISSAPASADESAPSVSLSGSPVSSGSPGSAVDGSPAVRRSETVVSPQPADASAAGSRDTLARQPEPQRRENVSVRETDAARPVEQYTNAYQSIMITKADMVALANRISRMNGFGKVERLPEGPGPDWVSPGTRLILPEGIVYTVADGDSLWSISLEVIHQNLNRGFSEFSAVRGADDRELILRELELIRQRSYCEQFILLVDAYRRKVVSGN